jgi:hypothetical protein
MPLAEESWAGNWNRHRGQIFKVLLPSPRCLQCFDFDFLPILLVPKSEIISKLRVQMREP